MEQLEFKFDTQLLIDGHDLDEDIIVISLLVCAWVYGYMVISQINL